MTTAKAAHNEAERRRLLEATCVALKSLLPGETGWIYGSVVRAGGFNQYSDIDVALARRPPKFSEFWLQGELELRLGRRVDVVVLGETRLADKITREGRKWTP